MDVVKNSKQEHDMINLIKLGWKAGAVFIVTLSVVGAGVFLHSTNANAWDNHQSSSSPTPNVSHHDEDHNDDENHKESCDSDNDHGTDNSDDVCPTPTPSPTPTQKPTPVPTPTPTPSPAIQNPPSFPKCSDQTGIGDNAHYSSGLHQIVGNGLLEGQDDVYTLSNGNFLQCYVPIAKDVCIQTNWWRTDQVLAGWYSQNGLQWNLGNFHYLAKNLNYNCQPEPTPSPTPSPTPAPSPTPTPVATSTNTNNNSNEQHQDQTQNNNQTVNVTVNQTTTATTGQVEGTKSANITKSPETGVSVLSMTTMFGILPFGLFLARFGKRRKLAVEQINLATLGNALVRIRTKGAKKA